MHSVREAGWKILWAKYIRHKAVVHVDMGDAGEMQLTGHPEQTIEDLILVVERDARKALTLASKSATGQARMRDAAVSAIVRSVSVMTPADMHKGNLWLAELNRRARKLKEPWANITAAAMAGKGKSPPQSGGAGVVATHHL